MNAICLLSGLGNLAVVTVLARAETAPATTRFQFREPKPTTFLVEEHNSALSPAGRRYRWVTAWPENGSPHAVEFGPRVALQLKPGADIREIL